MTPAEAVTRRSQRDRPPREANLPMDHFIFTRFNIRMVGLAPPSEDWLRHRVAAFQRYCLPSVRAQTEQRFYWLLFCDAESPPWLRRWLDDIQYEPLRVVWVEGEFGARHAQESVRAIARASRVVTTRLDNDDAIARSYVARIQAKAEALPPGTFLNFPHGLQYANRRLSHTVDFSNAFISFVERHEGGRPSTVYIDSHDQLRQHGCISQVIGRPAWLQVIHQRNLANRAKGFPAGPRHAGRDFALDLDLELMSGRTLRNQQIRAAARLARTAARDSRRLLSVSHQVFRALTFNSSRGRRRQAT